MRVWIGVEGDWWGDELNKCDLTVIALSDGVVRSVTLSENEWTNGVPEDTEGALLVWDERP